MAKRSTGAGGKAAPSNSAGTGDGGDMFAAAEPKPTGTTGGSRRGSAESVDADEHVVRDDLRRRSTAVPDLGSIIGQKRAIHTLMAAMRCGRVHHAWIFAGPPGIGKRTTAVAFAATLLDPTTSEGLSGVPQPDPNSQTQRLIAAKSHPDLHLITKELAAKSSDDVVRRSKQTSIAKEVVQEFLVEPANKARVVHSGTSIGKVFIIDEAELLNDSSQNSLLKTIEEPPEGTLLVLVTSSEERLLTTIRSRCQRVEFSSLDQEDMIEWLRVSGLELPPIQMDWIIRASTGSPGEAKLAAERDLYRWEEELGPLLDSAMRGKYSIGLAGTMSRLIDEQAANEVKINSEASKDGANKMWARRMLAFVADRLRRLLHDHVKTIRAQERASELVAEDPKTVRLLHMIHSVAEADRHIATNVSLGLALENLVSQFIAEPEPVG